MSIESPDKFSKFLSVLDNISGWTFSALAISSAFLIYWSYDAGVDLTVFRKDFGGWLFVVMVISIFFVISRVGRNLHASLVHRKAKMAFHFTPIELQCLWHAAKQNDGRIFTQILADCKVLNLTNEPLFFHSVKLIKPKLKDILVQPEINVFRATLSQMDYIPSFETNRVRISFFIRTPIGKAGNDLKIIAEVMDRFGNKQRVRIILRDSNTKI